MVSVIQSELKQALLTNVISIIKQLTHLTKIVTKEEYAEDKQQENGKNDLKARSWR